MSTQFVSDPNKKNYIKHISSDVTVNNPKAYKSISIGIYTG